MAYTDIDKPSDFFNTKLFTGNGSTNAITGVGFQPDWIWFKNRTQGQSHAIVDSVRGRKGLQSNSAEAEYTLNSGRDFGTFDNDGFTVLNPEQLNSFNYNNGSIVSWNWKAGTSFTNDASSTGIGSIDSAGSFNNDAGFSIFTFTGTGSIGTIKHGLNTKPDVIFIKGRSEAKAWTVYHSSLGAGKALFLQATDAAVDHPRYWNDVEPTTSVFTGGSSTNLTGSGITFVGYAFTAKKGYSKFGSYVGNGNADGTFIYTGFKPAFVMTKPSNKTGEWFMIDNKRDPSNYVRRRLKANSNAAENTDDNQDFDILSNGFKPRRSAGDWNSSGDTFIYMAFAEQPFTTSTGVPATAR